MSLEYDKKLIPNAKSLRKSLTPQERKLWYEFLSAYSPRFQRQKVIDHYIVDFYCAKAKLVLELDGSGHYIGEQMKHDEERTRILEKSGLQVLRFTNIDVIQNLEGVCIQIDRAVKSRMQEEAKGKKSI